MWQECDVIDNIVNERHVCTMIKSNSIWPALPSFLSSVVFCLGRLVEHKRRVLRSAETSGESTPSSTVARHISTR
jgi:hypothetical protein